MTNIKNYREIILGLRNNRGYFTKSFLRTDKGFRVFSGMSNSEFKEGSYTSTLDLDQAFELMKYLRNEGFKVVRCTEI